MGKFYSTANLLSQNLSELKRGDFVYSLHHSEWLFVIDRIDNELVVYNKKEEELFKIRVNTEYTLVEYYGDMPCDFEDYALYFSEYKIPEWLNVPVNEYKLNNVNVIEECEYQFGQFVEVSEDNKNWKWRKFLYKLNSEYFYITNNSNLYKVKYVKKSRR